MTLEFDVEKINCTLLDFYNATGIYMELYRADFSSVSNRSHWENNRYCRAVQSTKAGRCACLDSDRILLERCRVSRRTEMHICHAGLIDAAVPILYGDAVLGYILFGQIRSDTEFSAVRDYLTSLKLPPEQMKEEFQCIPVFSAEKIESISRIAGMLVSHILLEDMLKPDYDENIRRATAYIEENLAAPLTVQTIAHAVNVSKSVLYRRFHSCYGCTVNTYIMKVRLGHAADLLAQTQLSIEEIARRTGFSGTSYFSRNFRQEHGVTPLKYRKLSRLADASPLAAQIPRGGAVAAAEETVE